MRKTFISLIALIMTLIIGTCDAATYTMPEKMKNQLAIGSGLKGTFSLTAEGEHFRSPFMDVITDAEFSVRGISSDQDFHYYVFQSDEQENQSAVSELYRKDGICYFRSDMVQGKILSLPTLSQIIDVLFPARGENGSSSSFVSGIISVPEEKKKENWDPVLTRYQNELELWLADFTVNADTVKLESGFSALDFTYEIPIDKITDKIISLYTEITSDPEAMALFSDVMTENEKKIFMNKDLIGFYRDALTTLVLDEPVRMNKRVSAMGDLLKFSLNLPLDENTTGYRSLDIETVENITQYTLKKKNEILVVGIPEKDRLLQPEFEASLWYAKINTEAEGDELKENRAIKIDIKKTTETHEEDEKSHETDHFTVSVVQDASIVPEGTDLTLLPAFEPVNADIDLHYSSKFAQNSATSLEIHAEIKQGGSVLTADASLKTAAPWLFMPFEVVDPIETGAKKEDVLVPYLTDWISNAASMIKHTVTGKESNQPASAENTESISAETAESENQNEADIPSPDDNDEDRNAESQPLGDTAEP